MSREQWLAGRPVLTPENERVLDVWRFCSGWNPALLPLAAAYFEIGDVDFLITQLMALRETVDAHKAAQRRP